MLTPAGVKLLDFGLAKAIAATAAASAATLQKSLTAEGTVVGTLQYMAPEQLEGREADARGDVFALGAILYEMVSWRRQALRMAFASTAILRSTDSGGMAAALQINSARDARR